MTSVRVLVDSSAGVEQELARRWGLGVVPFYLTWGGQTYRDGIDLLPGDFYARLRELDENPKTAAPNPADFARHCTDALQAGQGVVIVTASSRMSAAYTNACLAAQELGDDMVKVVDSRQGAGAQALTAARAAAAAAQGAGIAEVVAVAEEARERAELFMVVSTLRYLRRSGRLSATQAILGDAIRLRPILTFDDGTLSVLEKPRTTRRAVERMFDRAARRRARDVLVMYADDPSGAEDLRRRVAERMPDAAVEMSFVSGVVGGHTGPGLLGLASLD